LAADVPTAWKVLQDLETTPEEQVLRAREPEQEAVNA
jgi:hypothetical protein